MNDRERAICARVKQFREQIKWPQPAFAFELRISKDQLASIEYGRTPLKYGIGYQICLLFEVSEAWLATGTGPISHSSGSTFWPGNLPQGVLFSEVYDAYFGWKAELIRDTIVPTKSAASRESSKEHSLPPLGDVTARTVKMVLASVEHLRFQNRGEENEFLSALQKAVAAVSSRFKKEKLKAKIKTAGGILNLHQGKTPDLSQLSPREALQELKRMAKSEQDEVERGVAADMAETSEPSKPKKSRRAVVKHRLT